MPENLYTSRHPFDSSAYGIFPNLPFSNNNTSPNNEENLILLTAYPAVSSKKQTAGHAAQYALGCT